MAAMSAGNWNPVLKAFRKRLKGAGKMAKVVIVAHVIPLSTFQPQCHFYACFGPRLAALSFRGRIKDRTPMAIDLCCSIFWRNTAMRHPAYARKRAEVDQSTTELAKSILSNRKRGTTPFKGIVIPAVVHVIPYLPPYKLTAWEGFKEFIAAIPLTGLSALHGNYPPYDDPVGNISDAQIQSQIEALNRDFRMRIDKTKIPLVFREKAKDSLIEFELAKTDPSGKVTNGITRAYASTKEFFVPEEAKSGATGGVDPWDPTKYLNIWVVNKMLAWDPQNKPPTVDNNRSPNEVYGAGTFPYLVQEEGLVDGLVIENCCFGTLGTAKAPRNLGKTATHEIGHWLNLEHLWGDAAGNPPLYDDYCDDTPVQEKANYGSPKFPHYSTNKFLKKDNKKEGGDMFMNFMDYSDDKELLMFTEQQVARMHATLMGFRKEIGRRS
jgi:hypothetical protein